MPDDVPDNVIGLPTTMLPDLVAFVAGMIATCTSESFQFGTVVPTDDRHGFEVEYMGDTYRVTVDRLGPARAGRYVRNDTHHRTTEGTTRHDTHPIPHDRGAVPRRPGPDRLE